jgi:hypothetical protein
MADVRLSPQFLAMREDLAKGLRALEPALPS